MIEIPTPPEEITGKGNIGPTTPANEERRTPDVQRFHSFMQETPKPAEMAPGTEISPMDLLNKSNLPKGAPTTKSLLEQMNAAQDELETVQQNLQFPQLKLKRSAEHLLNNKLTDANQNLRFAAGKLGLEPPPATITTGLSPLDKLITFAADGQNQLLSVKQELHKFATNRRQMNPADMMLVQIKLAQAQQEIEYSSILISKIVDSIKQMMNIQI